MLFHHQISGGLLHSTNHIREKTVWVSPVTLPTYQEKNHTQMCLYFTEFTEIFFPFKLSYSEFLTPKFQFFPPLFPLILLGAVQGEG